MKDNKGSLYIIEAILAITILLVAVLVVNTVISIPSPDYSYESHDLVSAQDTMEILAGKIDFEDQTFLGEITTILKENKNSKKSISEVSEICQNKLDSFKFTNYKFCENNKLKGKVLAYKGNDNNAKEVSVATRTYGDYSYTLYVW
ncbi:MAG: hypothetical protein U0L42_04860 [Methanobrevibacter sp.]|uniref:hypothetical protein n=1 Tax=Methanobrevibacter sp. TaxID=66852 RepID=UPI002E77702D|nr:hypothetical protein [Methanobrevibacter sp.]MEE0934984.1 hypothetical protein [Methanobrevibacter sp.]